MAQIGFVDQDSLGNTEGGTGVTTGTGAAIDCRGLQLVTAYQTSYGTTTGGTILIETAPISGYTGTWSQAASLDPNDTTGGKTKGTALPIGAYSWVRARVSSDVTGGGTVAIRLTGV